MTATQRLGVLLMALPLSEVRRLAKLADQQGFENAWFPEITFSDAFIPVAAASLETSRIRLATGVVGIWSRSPAAMALTTATLNQFCNGRLILGLGLQARSYVENWHGVAYERPVRAMREYVTILRQILTGKSVTYEGEIFRIKNFQMHIPPADPPIPIYIAAIGPKMLQLAGELADGVLGYFYSVAYFKEVALPNLRIGAERAGRSLQNLDIACGLPTIITDDDSGLQLNKGQILMFTTAAGSSPFYLESLARAGFGDKANEVQKRFDRKDLKGALQVITEEMVDAFTISGTADHAQRRINEYFEAGANMVVLNPSPPGVYFPLYQGHFPEGAEIPPFSFPDYLQVIERLMDFAGQAVGS